MLWVMNLIVLNKTALFRTRFTWNYLEVRSRALYSGNQILKWKARKISARPFPSFLLGAKMPKWHHLSVRCHAAPNVANQAHCELTMTLLYLVVPSCFLFSRLIISPFCISILFLLFLAFPWPFLQWQQPAKPFILSRHRQ